MIEVRCIVPIREINGVECGPGSNPPRSAPQFAVRSHPTDSNLVLLDVEDRGVIAVHFVDLQSAIRNATNVNR